MKSVIRALLIVVVILSVALSVAPARAAEDIETTADVVYGHKHGMALTFDVFKPKQEAKGIGVLFMVSGGWYSRWVPPEKLLPLVKPLLDKGFTVFAVRHGSSPKYVIPEVIEDVRRSVRFIRLRAEEFGVDPARLGVYGFSAGGHLSLILGTTCDEGDPDAKDEVLRTGDRVAAVAAFFPPTDVRPWVDPESSYYKNYPALQFEAEKAADCSPLLHVTEDDPPTLLVHGDKDELVPIDHSQKIIAEFTNTKVPCELIVIEGAAHGFSAEGNKRAFDALVAWFEKHLAQQ